MFRCDLAEGIIHLILAMVSPFLSPGQYDNFSEALHINFVDPYCGE